jgi:UTP:GlnB (protein PII) uridylyltransferase
LLLGCSSQKVVVVNKKRTCNIGVESAAIAKDIILFAIVINLCFKIFAGLLEAEFFHTANGFSVDVFHMIFE